MQLLAAAILGALIQGASTLVGRILISLGIGFVTYSGLDAAVDWAFDQVVSNIQGLPADVLQLLGVLQVDTAITMISSAYTARLALAGLSGGSIRKMVLR